MARQGSFIGPTAVYGTPLSTVQPADNVINRSPYYPGLLDPKLKLTDDQRRQLNDEINALAAILRIARDLPPSLR
jgi:hypothetical protein